MGTLLDLLFVVYANALASLLGINAHFRPWEEWSSDATDASNDSRMIIRADNLEQVENAVVFVKYVVEQQEQAKNQC